MTTHHFLTQFSTVPVYNTKAVAQETGVPADTFRAWERRYGVPCPHRTKGGHRLYSEREIAIIRWLRDRTAEGLTISQAIALMTNSNDTSLEWMQPLVDTEPHSWERLIHRLCAALTDFDEKRAEHIVSEAFALYALDDVLLKLLKPTLVEIGTRWHEGMLNATVEHFATQFIRRKFFSILNTYALTDGRGMILAGCAPSELHDTGILLLSIILVRHGWQVIYLGAQVPIPDLMDSIQYLHPDMVCMSASSQETALELMDVGKAIAHLPPPRPYFGYGGQIFNQEPAICTSMPGTFLGHDTQEAIGMIADMLKQTTHGL